MNYVARVALVTVALAGLVSCRFPGQHSQATPTGQVAATVQGQEITVREIGVELGSFSSPDPKIRKLAQTAALENIVARKIVAQAAVAQGVDKTPDYAMLKQRAIDNLLGQLLEKKLAEGVPPPSKEQAEAYVTEHPEMFAQRKIFVVNQLRMMRPADPSVLKPLSPLKTMPEVEAALDKDHIAYQKGVGTLDTFGAEPKLIDQVLKLPAGEIFIIPSGAELLVNQIRETEDSPITGDTATQAAMTLLRRQQAQDAVQKQLSAVVGRGLAEVRFNKDYAPAKRPAAPQTSPARGE